MVKITNGINIFEVTKGAYTGIYSRLGFSLVKEEIEEKEEVAEVPKSEEDIFVSSIVEKPIGSWTKAEAKRFADINGIDLSKAEKFEEVKNIIKDFIDSEQ